MMRISRDSHQYFDRERRAWIFRQKLAHPWAGLKWFTRDSGGNLHIVGRHWPHMLCWSWFVMWRWPDGKSGEHHKWGVHRFVHNGGGWLVAGPLWLHWQTYDSIATGQHAERFNAWLKKKTQVTP